MPFCHHFFNKNDKMAFIFYTNKQKGQINSDGTAIEYLFL